MDEYDHFCIKINKKSDFERGLMNWLVKLILNHEYTNNNLFNGDRLSSLSLIKFISFTFKNKTNCNAFQEIICHDA